MLTLLRTSMTMLALAGFAATPVAAADPPKKDGVFRAEIIGTRWEFENYFYETDVGEKPDERKKFAQRIMKPVLESTNFYIGVFQMKPTCFKEFANYHPGFDPLVRIRVFRRYEDFLKDFQARYQTKTLPGAFFGTISHKDEYGKDTGQWFRECATDAENKTDAEILRSLYHELGHLFMNTFMISYVEVPSWIEEGMAQLFEYRKGNGTNPEAERDQRLGWLVEMCAGGRSIPWNDFTRVRNLDNLDFTHLDPLRSTVQYAQAWSVMEFMIATPKRAAAFNLLLKEFKKEGERAQGSGEARRMVLYPVQDALFKKFFGADLLAVEDLWKKWVRDTYDQQVKSNPILRYYRGEWHIGYLARFAKDADAKAAELAAAEALFEECVTESPKLPEGYVGLGRVAMEKGKLVEAGAQFDKALTLGGDSFEALLYGGIARVRSGRAAEAVAPLTKAATQRPTSSDVQFFLGQALAVSGGDADKAVDALKKCRDLSARDVGVCSRLEGGVHYRNGRADRAFIAWLRAWNLEQGDPLLTMLLAICKATSNEPDEAMGFLGKLGKDPAAQHLAKLIKDGKPMPAVVWRNGWPNIDFAGEGDGEQAKGGEEDKPKPKPGEKSKAGGKSKPEEAKPDDLFGK